MTTGYFIDWPAPASVRAFQTVRQGGVSEAPFASLNLAMHVGDQSHCVRENRNRLAEGLALRPDAIRWLNQVHSGKVIEFSEKEQPADGCFSRGAGQVCVVMTADCLPVLLCDQHGTQVAAVHCGWRGLVGGVIESALRHFSSGVEVMAWLGPAIGPDHFEVGGEVFRAFVEAWPEDEACFVSAGHKNKWMANLYALAANRLQRSGVRRVFGGGQCTYCDSDRYYSYRRDVATGRQATLIWIK